MKYYILAKKIQWCDGTFPSDVRDLKNDCYINLIADFHFGLVVNQIVLNPLLLGEESHDFMG